MKYKDIKDQTPEELKSKLRELYKDLMQDYVQISSGTIPQNPGQVKEKKKSIAKIKTALRQVEE